MVAAQGFNDHPLGRVKDLAERAMAPMHPFFVAMAAGGSMGAPSSRELMSMFLMALYDIPTESQFCQHLATSPLFRWFVGLPADEAPLAEGPFALMRNRLLQNRAASEFFARLIREMRDAGLLSGEHFQIDARQLAVWSARA
jgi:transposase